MSVEYKELKCCEYVASVRHISKYIGQGIYGLDKIRAQAHDKLCELFNLAKEDTLQFTDNLDLDDPKCAENLYFDLKDMEKKS